MPRRWYLGSQNDGLFIIDTPPRPSKDDEFFERTDGPTFAIPVNCLGSKIAQMIIDQHNLENDNVA